MHTAANNNTYYFGTLIMCYLCTATTNKSAW